MTFWLLLYGGIPGVLAMHLQRKETKTYKIATPMTVLVLAGMAGTANMIGSDNNVGPVETAEALLHLVIPTGIYLIGSCLAIFGGPSPVGAIPKNWRRGGSILMIIAIGWVIMLSLQPENLPIETAVMNNVAISSLLIAIALVGAVGTTVVLSIGEKRWLAAIATISLSVGSIALLAILASEISEEIGDSLKSIIGTIFGIIIALWIAFHTTILIEKRSDIPKTTTPITDQEVKLVKHHLDANIRGDKIE